MVSQTIIKALDNRSQFEGEYIRSWLISILNRTFWKESSRQEYLAISTLAENLISGENVLCTVAENIFMAEVVSQLDMLPTEYSVVIALCDIEQMSYEEAAASLSIPLGTVRSRLFRGRRMLRERLAPFLESENV